MKPLGLPAEKGSSRHRKVYRNFASQKGQSIAHIYASHADEIACSRRTIYSYIDRGVFQARNIDLRRKVVYKQRKRKTTTSLKDRSFRKGRGYKEFLEYIAANKSVYVVEMDTVEGAKGTSPCFLTMFFRNCSLMLMFLLEEQTQKEVTRIFDHLTELLGIELFQKLFEVILTDNGHEFQDRQSLEYSKNDEVRTRIYCFVECGLVLCLTKTIDENKICISVNRDLAMKS